MKNEIYNYIEKEGKDLVQFILIQFSYLYQREFLFLTGFFFQEVFELRDFDYVVKFIYNFVFVDSVLNVVNVVVQIFWDSWEVFKV